MRFYHPNGANRVIPAHYSAVYRKFAFGSNEQYKINPVSATYQSAVSSRA